MYDKSKKNKNPQRGGQVVRQFCVIVAALFVALAVCGGTLSYRFYGGGEESEGTFAPLFGSGVGRETTADTREPETIAPETDLPVPPETVTAEITSAPTSQTTRPPVSTTPKITTPKITTPPVTPPSTTKTPVTTPPVTKAPVTEPAGDDDPERLTTHILVDPPVTEPPQPVSPRVEARETVGSDYFADALFIGDSRTVGLQLYSGLKSTYYSQQGLNVSSVVNSAFVPSGDKKLTLSEALDANPQFTKVYISFGINEIGWPSTDSFIKAYTTLVELVLKKLPDAHVYVQEILPMTAKTAANDRYSAMGGNGKVAEYNDRLFKLCEEMGVHYLALTEVFTDADGALNVSDTFDGIHLGVASSKAWIEYLKNHTVP